MGNDSNIQVGKRIAKNTLYLYMRMIFLVLVSLYTSRVILDSLGVNDYGYYNVIGGVVAMFAILTQSLSNAVSRFLNFEMGKDDKVKLKKVFSCSLTILVVLAVVAGIIADVGGSWWINNKMVIEQNRLEAANYVLHFSVIAFCITLISAPYNAAIIAHEKMSAFAYISIFECLAKLLIAFLICICSFDRLSFYAFLVLIVQVCVFFTYKVYCKRNFSECSYHIFYDTIMLKEICSYAGWTFIGNAAYILKKQGGNIILNMFAGPAVNAARGIAMYVDTTVASFSNNFFVAVKPQLTQSYARGDRGFMMNLVFRSSRLSFFLLLVMGLPVIMSSDYIMNIWLKEVPEYTSEFVDLMLINLMIESISQPLIVVNGATGRIRNYQLIVGGLQLMNLPISYIFLANGFTPTVVVFISIALDIFSLIARMLILKYQIELPLKRFSIEVIFNVTIVSILSAIPSVICRNIMQEGFLCFAVTTTVCIVATMLSVWFVGCNASERQLLSAQIDKIKKKFTGR